MPVLRYTSMVNGFDSLVITKLDVLYELDQIKVCVAYRLKGKELREMLIGIDRGLRICVFNDEKLAGRVARRCGFSAA